VGSGQLLGILGGSGSGKTTLLNAISGRILNKKPSTIIQYKGIAVNGCIGYKESEFKLGDSDSIKYISAYVMQNDIMCPTVTGREALLFSSKLRSTNPIDKQLKIIDSVIDSLKLNDCQHTRVGNDAIRGISGGEHKRLIVGIELVTEPSLILLDEPTSGLDSFTALKTLDILKNLTTKQGKQVIATIHQPSTEIFDMIDILILLVKGYCVYYGSASQVVQYFDRLGYECPQYTNIADYVINRIEENSDFFIEKWKQYEKEYINLDFKSYDILYPEKVTNSSFCRQFTEIIKREFQILVRDPRPSKIRFAQTVTFSILIGILFFNLPYDPEGLRNRFGAIFFLTVNSSLIGLIGTILVFPEQRLLHERERDASMYYTTTYLTAKFLVQLPEQALFTLIYPLICYWMVGFDSSFIELYIALLLCTLSTSSVGLIVGCFAKNVSESLQALPIAFIPFLLFANFLVSLDQIPVWMRWLQWIDPFKYVVDSLSITEFKGQLHDYDEITQQWSYDGDEYLHQIGAGYSDTYWIKKKWINSWEDSIYFDWICLIFLIFGFRIITCLILVNRSGF